MVEPIYDTACGDMGEPIHDSDMGREMKYLLSEFKTSLYDSDTSRDLVQELTNQPTYLDKQITWCQQVQVSSTAMEHQV